MVGAGSNLLCKYSYKSNIQLMKWQDVLQKSVSISPVDNVVFQLKYHLTKDYLVSRVGKELKSEQKLFLVYMHKSATEEQKS